jgi:uncharacterized protein (UPF0303 family)
MKNLSYFDKMEGLKRKVKETHRLHKTSVDLGLLAKVKTQDVQTITDGRQPAHPDWLKAKLNFTQAAKSSTTHKVIDLDQYAA